MKTEISAGGVIVHKVGHAWQLLLMRDMNGSWTFPKGLINKNEEAYNAAKREIKEELGIDNLQFVKDLPTIEYWYKRRGLIHKTVHYFLFEVKCIPKIQVQKQEGISEAKWFNFTKAIKVVGYPKTNQKLIQEVKRILS